MGEYSAATYGDRWADRYDAWIERFARPSDAESASAVLAELASGGRALELAIGTGRVALPLAARGIEVHGIDASERMVGRLRQKPGGEGIPVTIGDFSDVGVGGRFEVIYVVFNTFFALLSQDDQARCFVNVAEHLTDQGAFVLEAFVPDVARFDRGQRVQAVRVDTDEVVLDVSVHDPKDQRVTSSWIEITPSGVDMLPIRLRYAWPGELDLMARAAGLALRERWSGWDRSAFSSASAGHVSVYGRP